MERGIIKLGHRGSSRIGGWPELHHRGGGGDAVVAGSVCVLGGWACVGGIMLPRPQCRR